MSATLKAGTLYNSLKDKLGFRLIAGEDGRDRVIHSTDENDTKATLVGHMNFIHPHRIQVLGTRELEYLRSLRKNSRKDTISQLFSELSALVIVTDNQVIPDDFLTKADDNRITLIASPLTSQEIIQNLQYYLSNFFAEKITMHGVFMEVMGTGVLIVGESSIGKSELALELLTRGHRLIADDAPEFSRIAPDTLNGRCPEMLRDFLEVRGLGVLNVRAMFGDSSIKENRNLRLIIVLQDISDENIDRIDRLRGSRRVRTILGVNVPEVTLPVGPGRNLSVLVESAVRNHILISKGYDAGRAFVERQKRRLEGSMP